MPIYELKFTNGSFEYRLSLIHIFDPETGFEWIGEYDITADELLSGAGGNNATKTEQAEKLILDQMCIRDSLNSQSNRNWNN